MLFKGVSKLGWRLLGLLLTALPLNGSATPVQLNWNSWSLEYDVSSEFDGLSLINVRYQNKLILGKASLPVVQAFTSNEHCGPYATRLGPANRVPITWADNSTIVSREFVSQGQTWYELGIEAHFGNYQIYQAWYLNPDGILDAYVFSKGFQCKSDYTQYPLWRMDVDIAGKGDDQLRLWSEGSWKIQHQEFDADGSQSGVRRWQIRDLVSGDSVDLIAPDNGWNPPGLSMATGDHGGDVLYGRQFRPSEDSGWTVGSAPEVPYGNDDSLDAADIVLWYRGALEHAVGEGPGLWRSTGLRLIVNFDDPATRLPPSVRNPGAQSNAVGEEVELATVAADPDGNSLSFSSTGLPLGLAINSATGQVSGKIKGAGGTYTVTIGASNGQAVTTTTFIWTVTEDQERPAKRRLSNFGTSLKDWAKYDAVSKSSTSRPPNMYLFGATVLERLPTQSGVCQ